VSGTVHKQSLRYEGGCLTAEDGKRLRFPVAFRAPPPV
jgi:hypothetical protein